jgi:large subunit ribosomal protein L25
MHKFSFYCYTKVLKISFLSDKLPLDMKKIEAKTRKLIGKKSKILLKNGIIPGVMYNNKTESTSIELVNGDAIKSLRGVTSTTMFDLSIDGKSHNVIVRDIAIDPKTDDFTHVVFFELDEKSTFDFDIPFVLEGISPAVKNNLGSLVQPNTSLLVRCLIKNLPESIVIDISGMEHPGQSIKVSDIKLPEGVAPVHKEDLNNPVVTITQLQKEEVIEKPVVAEGEEGAVEGEEGVEGAEGVEGEGVEGEEGAKGKDGAKGEDKKASGDDKGKKETTK